MQRTMSKEKLKIDLIKGGQRPTDGLVLEESRTLEVRNKINIPCNGRQWEFVLTTFILIQPPLGVDEEPTLKILDSFTTHSPLRHIEEIILDRFKDNIEKENNHE